MEVREDNARQCSLNGTLRNLSSSSSAFFSANQSPFISPNSAARRLSTQSENPCLPANANMRNPYTTEPCASNDPGKVENSSVGVSTSPLSNSDIFHQAKKFETPASYRSRSCDVYIGFQGRKPLLLRFINWLRAELELQGLSCFVTDRGRCRNAHKHGIIEKAMDASAFGVVILTRKSFRNAYTIEELRYFSGKKNLVPVYFDLGPDDCHVRDIVEKRGEVWEKYGGELWMLYGGVEKEWREAVGGISRVDEWRLDARDGKWRDCILRAVTVMAFRLGRRSIVDRLTKWGDKTEKEEFPYLRSVNFVGRKKELYELEFMLFGDVSGETEREYFELKTRKKKKKKNVTIAWGRTSSVDEKRLDQKGKKPVIWKESEKEIEMENVGFSKIKRVRRRPLKVVYGKGIACVTGESGIGKTELVLEFAYRFHQRYKMVLWIGGESRYIRQNYMNLWTFLEIDVGMETAEKGGRPKSFEEQEEAAIARIRRELMRNIPFLVIIDNLESEKDWWDQKHIMDLLPRFGGETHVIISTRLSRVMNIEPLRLSYLSGVEAMFLMQGNVRNQSVAEIDALHVIEEKLGRLTLGLAIVGAIISELCINPVRLLDTVNRMPSRHDNQRNSFLLQLFEVCFSIFDNADGARSLAGRMVLASGWFGPGPIPVAVLSSAANKLLSEKDNRSRLWSKILTSLTCGFGSSTYGRSDDEAAASMLVRFNIARNCVKNGVIQFNRIVKLYSRKRGTTGSAQAMVRAVLGCNKTITLISPSSDHIWAACFLLLGFGKDPKVVELKVNELVPFIKEVVVPFAIRTFITFSRCSAAMEVLRLCTEVLEATDQAFVTPVDKWLDKSLCWRPVQTNAQMNPCLWQDLALVRATVLEVWAKLMVRGGQLDVADDLIRKAVFVRSSICGEDHPDTVSARETLAKLTRLVASVHSHG